MADIELVIKIPEGLKKDFELEQWTALSCMEMKDALMNGTSLPKVHGRLIDADAYLKKACTYKETGCGSCRFQTVCPIDEPTIIEADKGETE